ncbi:MAG TPA: hypothetical protein VIO14_13415 [Dehalococcoidia bacterium]
MRYCPHCHRQLPERWGGRAWPRRELASDDTRRVLCPFCRHYFQWIDRLEMCVRCGVLEPSDDLAYELCSACIIQVHEVLFPYPEPLVKLMRGDYGPAEWAYAKRRELWRLFVLGQEGDWDPLEEIEDRWLRGEFGTLSLEEAAEPLFLALSEMQELWEEEESEDGG